MGYIRRGLDLLKSNGSSSSYIEACRFARDTMRGLAVVAFVGAGVVEVAVDNPRKTGVAIGLTAASAMLELGARANQQNIESEEYYFGERAGA